jgi:hypothetical protein
MSATEDYKIDPYETCVLLEDYQQLDDQTICSSWEALMAAHRALKLLVDGGHVDVRQQWEGIQPHLYAVHAILSRRAELAEQLKP